MFEEFNPETEVYDVWITKTGARVKISDMETSHIKNCINRCNRYGWRLKMLPLLKNELKARSKGDNMLKRYDEYLQYLEVSVHYCRGLKRIKAQLKFMAAMALPLVAIAMVLSAVYLGILNVAH